MVQTGLSCCIMSLVVKVQKYSRVVKVFSFLSVFFNSDFFMKNFYGAWGVGGVEEGTLPRGDGGLKSTPPNP